MWQGGGLVLWFGLGLVSGLHAGEAGSPASAPTVNYAIVVTGGELLDGAYADAHTLFLTRTLRPLGLHCVGSAIVDDKPADIHESLRQALARADLVLVTGGLGPTANDVTREVLAEATGIPLREHPEALAEMERRFKLPRDQLRANLRRQTQVPVGGAYLKNAGGTAVGLIFERPRGVVVALPGPPRELQAMVREELLPYLSRRFGARRPGCALTLRFVGVGQSQIDQALKQHAPMPQDMTVWSQFEGGRVDFAFTLAGDTPQDRARLQAFKQAAIKPLGEYLYADDQTTLEEHVAGLLQAQGATLAIAEAGSGGALAAGFSGSERAGRVLAGGWVAPSEIKLRGLLRIAEAPWNAAHSSAGRMELVAAAAAESAGKSWSIAVGEAVPDATGGRSVSAVFRPPGGHAETATLSVRGSGELARANLATQLLDQLRRRLRPSAGEVAK